jgi:phospholipid/cholesterol/gamma-HCH transport system substrate-binding protein
MKRESGNKARLGVFVALGILLLMTGIYFIGSRQQMFNDTISISGVFNDVNGLQVGNNVRFAGINVGTVDAIEIITDTTVKVDMIIDAETRKFIKKDAKAVISSDGLMGNRIMNITPGTSNAGTIEDNDVIGTTHPVSIEEILHKVKVTTDLSAQIAEDLAAITSSIRSGKGTIGKLFMDSSLATNLDRSIGNVRQGTKKFNENMDAAKHNFLLKGYFKKKEKEEVKKQKQQQREEERRLKKEKKEQEKKDRQEEDGAPKEKKGLFRLFRK